MRVITAATIDSLYERGWSSTTVTDIASRAGFTRQLVRHYFPSDADLLAAAIEQRSNVLFARLEEHLRQSSSDISATAFIDQLIMESWEMTRSRDMEVFRELLVMTRTDEVVGPAVRAACGQVLDRSDRVFRSVIAASDAFPVWVIEVAPAFVAAVLTGSAVLAQAAGDGGEEERSAAALRGLRAIVAALDSGQIEPDRDEHRSI